MAAHSTALAPHRPAPAGTRRHPQSDYAALKNLVNEEGLLDRRYRYYAIKGAALALTVVAIGVAFALIGDSWWQLVPAAALGMLLTHVAFLSHDAAHRQIFRSGPANEWLAACLGSIVMGMSAAWWQRKHTKHHASPNQIGKDPDIDGKVIAFYPRPERRHGPIVTFLRTRQGWWFFPILTFEGLNLHAQSVVTLCRRGPVKRRGFEISMMCLRWVAYLTVLFVVLSPAVAAGFLGVQLAIFGIYMGCTFAPNHKGMPVVPRDAKIDFFRRQVLMSRNISGSGLVSFAMGGLNYQIEHHLFPSMPRPNLRRARDIVIPFCAEREVTYAETTLARSYGIVVRYLNRVGLGARDPFECPVVATLRPRG